MPLFSKRKSGKKNSKDSKHAAGKDGAKGLPNHSLKLNQPEIVAQQGFNGVSSPPDKPIKDYLYRSIERPPNSTVKCVANFPRRSRLSKALPEVLVDNSVLPLFMEFLQRQNAQNILNFWLAAETFHLSSRDKTLLCYKSRLKTKNDHLNPVQKVNSNIRNVQNDSGDVIPTNHMQSTDRHDNTSEDLLLNRAKDDNSLDNSGNSNLISVQPSESSRFEDSMINYSASNATLKESFERRSSNHSSKDDNVRKDVTETQTNEGESDVSTLGLNYSAVEQTPLSGKDCTSEQQKDETREHRRQSKTMMVDALSIYRHFISLDATQSLGVDENVRREVETNICSENGEIDPDCFKMAQKFAFETLQTRYFDDFIRSSYYQKHIMEIVTSGKVFLADIMYNDNAVFYFMEFMEQEEKNYLLAFWFTVDSFCQELQSKLDKGEYNVDEALADAMVLYEKYFSMQATHSLGVSDQTRIRIENKICREGGPLPDCFEEPMENILTLLEEVYFPIFLESSVYFKYLNELFSSVTDVDSDQTSAYADDCSSTASGCETSKLMESLTNDVELQEDPDEIWQRPNIGLSIGRVNEYGVYEPWIEPQPEQGKKSGASKFGQKMRKFVSGDSHKVKEEMARQVAKMVLEDVKKQQRKAPR